MKTGNATHTHQGQRRPNAWLPHPSLGCSTVLMVQSSVAAQSILQPSWHCW